MLATRLTVDQPRLTCLTNGWPVHLLHVHDTNLPPTPTTGASIASPGVRLIDFSTA